MGNVDGTETSDPVSLNAPAKSSVSTSVSQNSAPRIGPATLALFCLTMICPSCAEDPAFAAARTSLTEFQEGLRNGDAQALRRCVTSKSRELVGRLPRRSSELALEVTKQTREYGCIYLDVRDPNPDAPVAKGRFVIAKEGGKWLVDLIATAGQGSRQIQTGPANAPKRFLPAPLTAEQRREAARALEASAKRR